MLDRDDEQLIKDSKAGGAVLVTWDRVLREAAGGMTPYQMLEQGRLSGKGTQEAQAEISRLIELTPEKLTVLAEQGNKAVDYFKRTIVFKPERAAMIRILRVDRNYSWRAIARYYAELTGAKWGSNQLAGMVICEKAAKMLNEDFLQPPWN